MTVMEKSGKGCAERVTMSDNLSRLSTQGTILNGQARVHIWTRARK